MNYVHPLKKNVLWCHTDIKADIKMMLDYAGHQSQPNAYNARAERECIYNSKQNLWPKSEIILRMKAWIDGDAASTKQ